MPRRANNNTRNLRRRPVTRRRRGNNNTSLVVNQTRRWVKINFLTSLSYRNTSPTEPVFEHVTASSIINGYAGQSGINPSGVGFRFQKAVLRINGATHIKTYTVADESETTPTYLFKTVLPKPDRPVDITINFDHVTKKSPLYGGDKKKLLSVARWGDGGTPATTLFCKFTFLMMMKYDVTKSWIPLEDDDTYDADSLDDPEKDIEESNISEAFASLSVA